MKRKIKKQYRTWRLLISSFILLSATGFALADNLIKLPYYRSLPNANTTYKQGELIVHFADVQPGTQPNDGPVIVGPLTNRAVKDTISDFIIPGSSVAKEYEHIKPGLALVKLPEDVPIAKAFFRFNRSSNILYAEPNYKYKLLIIPDDTRFYEQWGLNNFGQLGGTYDADIDAPEAWNIRTDSNTVVAVLDTGIDYTHPDLVDNMWINPAEVNDPCVVTPADFNDVDDDENGYVDDIYGYDFVEDDSEPFDENYHGTHVAGIIGAVGNNDLGVAGVCWRVKLMALRMADAGGDVTLVDAMEAIDYATKRGVDVISVSWGGYEYSYMLYNIIEDAQAAGIVFVAAAGNEGLDFAAYPAAYNLDNIISVMATNDSDNKWAFSNYSYNVDLGAPGEDILSTTPMDQTDVMTNAGVVSGYDYLTGTSMAAPHVSGACALLKAESPTSTYHKIKALIFHGVDPVLPDLCVTGGRLNLYRSLNMAQTGFVRNTKYPQLFPSIQQAIDYPLTADGHTLIAQAGYWYFETVDFKGKKVHLRSGNAIGTPGPLRQDITYISAFIDKYFASSGYVTPVVTFNQGEDNSADIAGFTIIDGDTGIECRNNSSPVVSYCNITKNEDIGVYCWNSSPTISDCNIVENEGSGIYCNNADPNINDCKITMNTSQGSGGGIYCNYGSDPDINDCLISYNVVAGLGGGMYIGGRSNPYIRNCIIFENEAYWEGGGIYVNNASPTITDSNITGCISQWDGGGIYCDNGADPNIQNCTINNNMAYFDAGAIYCNGTSPLIKNCLIIDNTVDSVDCGGIFCWDASPTITNCTLSGNSSNEFNGLGGAMFCLGTSKPVITNCIFSDNNDIAIYEYDLASDPNIKFSLFYNNPNGDYYDKDSGAIHDFNSLDPDNFLATMRHYDISNTNDSNNIDGNPMFVRGRLGNYYLSQFAAGQILDANGVIVDPNVNPQDATSPAVDAGSAIANVLGMHIYSTRTDNVADSGQVDIGFHYNDPVPGVMYFLSTNATNGTISPPSGNYIQYTQVLLEGAPADPNYQLKYWSGTDDDSSKELRNVVTMDYHKHVEVVFETILVYLRCRVVGGIGSLVPISPEPVETIRNRYYLYHRGTVVDLAVTPANPEHRAKWGGDVDNEFSKLLTNTVTMADGPYPVKPFTIDTQGKDGKVVEVEFYQPRILNVPGDYTNIQHAIYNANDDDIVLIAPGFYDISESSLPYKGTYPDLYEYPYLYISDKAITLSSINPDDPCVVAATIIYNCGFVIENVNRDTVIDGLTIQSAQYNLNTIWITPSGSGVDGPGGHIGDTYGGGMELLYNASPTVRNCRFVDCAVGGIHGGNGNSGPDERGWGGNGGWPGAAYGGGASVGWNCWPIFTNCSFIDCFVVGGDGGNGGSSPPGHGGGWGDPNALWWWEYWDVDAYGWGPLEEYWKYTGFGGAVYCAPYSNPEFVDCSFINNYSYGGSCGISGTPYNSGWPYSHYRIDSFGGAVYADDSSAPVFTGCNFINNEADVDGPATHLDGEEAVSDDPYISYGGAIAFEDGASPTFINCSFNDNIATIGGGIWATWSDPNIVDCNFMQNTAFHGGGVYFVGGTAKITQNIFMENEALYDTSIIDPINPDIIYGEGGAIYCFDGDASIADCDIFNNTAGGSGGGIYISGSAKPLVKNCLITENSANRDGGGISANWHSKSNIVNCTIAKNSATVGGTDTGFGGGLNCSYNSLVNILNSIIWGNFGTRGAQLSVCTGFKYDPIISTVDVNNSVIGPPEEAIEIIPAEVLDINVTNDASTLVNNILGPGIEVIGIPQYTGADTAAGTFVGGLAAGIGIESGIILTSGDANLALPPNESDGITGGDNLPGDPDLTALLQVGEVNEDVNTFDATILEFTFKSKGGNLFFNFVFASDEYNEFTNSQYNDVFGFFFDGTNIALIPGTTIPVTINNVNGGNPYGTNASNSHLFNNNDLNDGGPFFDIEYDGFTDVFTAQVYNIGSGTHTIKLAIADTSDYALDSAVFIQAGSFSDKPLYTAPVYIDTDCKLIGWIPNAPDPNNPWEPDTYNLRIDDDPCFIAGYYLSQIAAGQSVNSPCVDSGSADANAPSIGLDTYTTRTDSITDAGIVDMGYHYLPFFVPQYKLTVVEAIDVNVIEPNIYDPNYDGFYNWYTTVFLEVESPYDPNYQVAWTGADNDDPNYGGSTNTITMDSDKTVTIRLVKSKYELTINVDGGNGRLFADWYEGSSHYRIEDPCTNHPVKFGTVVELTAEPDTDKGYRVRRWIGTDNDSSRATTNTVTIDSDRNVRVEFETAKTITVPGDYSSIQNALDTAEEGDKIVVSPGNYMTSTGYNIFDKAVTITSTNPDDPCVVANTIIEMIAPEDADGWVWHAFTFYNVGPEAVLSGFTIRGFNLQALDGEDGIATALSGENGNNFIGGAIVCYDASPSIKNCIITDCSILGGDGGDGANGTAGNPEGGHGGWPGRAAGAGLACQLNSNPTVTNCIFRNCSVTGGNGGDGGNGNENPPGKGGRGGGWDYSYEVNWPYAYSVNPIDFYIFGDYIFPTYSYGQYDTYTKYSGLGGAVYIGHGCSPSFTACTFETNQSFGGNCGICGQDSGDQGRDEPGLYWKIDNLGGAVYCDANSSPEFADCVFTDNVADPNRPVDNDDPYVSRGGAVAFEDGATPTFTNCTFNDNFATIGGAIYLKDANAWIVDSNCLLNSAYQGGGIYGNNGSATIVTSIIQRNFAEVEPSDVIEPNSSGQGGGIYSNSMITKIFDSTITHNNASISGGGIYLIGPSDTQIINNLITNNLAGRDGGGISINWYAEPLISNCTFVSNAAAGTFGEAGNTGFGGGLYCSYKSDSEVIDSIFWSNYALKGSEIAVGTGFELDLPSTLIITYSDIKTEVLSIWVENGCNLVGWDKISNSWNPDTNNIDYDPLFVTGLLGDYYLSQTPAGQSQNSPCVNSGSDLASNVDMIRRTTRTDDVPDVKFVDMGYHYPLIVPCKLCDISSTHDGIINFKDFAMLVLWWLDKGCSDENDWCQGADVTYDTIVDFNDLVLFVNCWLEDKTPPIPNPSRWEIEPYLISATSIAMSAETSFDLWGWAVGYFFECAYGNCQDSGWQSSPTYTDSGLASGADYGYKVKARDALGNETEWSDISYAGQEDTTPPAPAPYINTIEALGSNSVIMTATIAYDESGVEYYFDFYTGDEHDSGWLEFAPGDEPNYTDTGLEPNATYYYRVKARDKSVAQNETAWSDWVEVTTILPLDNLPPEPDPMEWDPVEDANGYNGEPRLINIGGGTFDWYATMRAIQADDVAPPDIDPSGVEYKFVCVTSGLSALSSSWQTELTYTVQVGGKYVVTDWYVIARDTSPNYNTTAASPVVRALPPP